MDLLDDPAPGANTPEYSVSEISGAVKRSLEGEFGRIRVRGEVGRVFRARSGHLYYDVKDDRNVLACTTWKGQLGGLAVLPEEGLEVVVTGRLSAFGGQSKYNLVVDEVAVAGQGALMAMLETRKKALEAEGLFDAARKRPLPYLPEVIGVVTSPQGAVIRDILHRLRERFPRKVLVWPVAVQGPNCAPEVARAIAGFDALSPGGAVPRPDLVIVARGGGSIEDLWGFNEEVVARAAAASRIPLISAVGHETDTTLIDFVSDRRAPTPTAAAELAVPVRMDLVAWAGEQGARLARAQASGLARRGERVRDLARALPRPEALTGQAAQRFDLWAHRLGRGLEASVQARRVRLVERGGLAPATLRRLVEGRRDALDARGARLPLALEGATQRRGLALARVGAPRRRSLERAVQAGRADLAALARHLARAAEVRQRGLADRLAAVERLRRTLGYEATLERGYAVVRAGGAPVTRKAAAAKYPALEVQFADGILEVAVAPGARSAGGGRRKAPPSDDSGQGTLL
ncbi:MAG: exodeoxyribonuclease VII large subunit [Shimia sp.]